MAYQSDIQWTDATWNPWHGCKKVSPGCKYCYMYRDKERYGLNPSHVVKSKSKFYDPLKWMDPKMIFTCSWSDFFIEEADEWREEAWNVIRKTPHHTYQILTKRPERIFDNLPSDWGDGYDNVWMGVSIENQNQIERIFSVCEIQAKVRFISIEPLIGQLDLSNQSVMIKWYLENKIHWMIIGGESGNDTGKHRYRNCDLNWIKSIISNCQIMGIPVFVKQLGTYLSKELGLKHRHGGDISEWPEQLRIREFPKTYLNERTENQNMA